jgi:formylglycine-generating enzyme required for sulfatase activity
MPPDYGIWMDIMLRLLSFLLLLSLAQSTYAQRYALVIGNSRYGADIGELKNPVNDASDMAALLKRKDFNVIKLINADKRQMKEAISRFTQHLSEKNAVGLFFFAGHGVEVGGRNFLIPVNSNIQGEGDVEYEAIDAGRVMANMEYAGNNLNMVILDACRNNPFARSFRSASRGLARMDPPKGSLILYATSPGDVASDGNGRNGVFTQYLLKAIDTPGYTVEKVFKTTANQVYQATKKKQLPWQSGVMLGEFYFTINAPNAQTVTIAPTAVSKPTNSAQQAEILFWDSIKNETRPEFFQSYLDQYPEGIYVALAKLKLPPGGKVVVDAPVEAEPKGQLTVKTSPSEASVRILNIGPKYQEGIELKPGRYHIEVTAPGYERYLDWIELGAENKVHSVALSPRSEPEPEPAPRPNRSLPAMVTIPAGCFQMGSPSYEQGRDDDERQHRVCVERFELGKTEVTVGEFRRFVEATGYRTDAENNKQESGCYAYSSREKKWAWRSGYNWRQVGFNQNDRHPVVCVSWNDVNAYIAWLNRETGQSYRLPTEAEWEYAARGGTDSMYFWGNAVDSRACDYANIADKAHDWSNNFPCDDGTEFTQSVAQYRPNPFGLYDISGNVWEWTCSEYDKSYGGGEQQCLSKNNATNSSLVALRGGSFFGKPRRVRSANRNRHKPWERDDDRGFRLARTF